MGFIIYYLVLIVNPMGRILVRWKKFRNHLGMLCHPICIRLYIPKSTSCWRMSRWSCEHLTCALGDVWCWICAYNYVYACIRTYPYLYTWVYKYTHIIYIFACMYIYVCTMFSKASAVQCLRMWLRQRVAVCCSVLQYVTVWYAAVYHMNAARCTARTYIYIYI